MMRALRLLALACLVLVVGGGVFLWLSLRNLFGPPDIAAQMTALPRVALLEKLGDRAQDAEAILFQDGEDGWFLIPDLAPLSDVQIGFYGTRLGDALFGAAHVPLYCDGPGKAIWAVRNADLVAQLAYCAQGRMDLSEMRPFARPVTLHSETLERHEVEALRNRIAATPGRLAVTLPTEYQPFDQSRTITLPAYWYAWDSDGHQGTSQRIEAALHRHLATFDGAYQLQARHENVPERTRFVPDAQGVSVPAETGPLVSRDGEKVLLTEINWITIPRYVVSCAPEACAALDSFDAKGLVASRDMALLERAVANAVPVPDVPIDAVHTPAHLRDTATTVGPVTPYTYSVRWAEPRP